MTDPFLVTVVDDDPAVRSSLSFSLGIAGFRVQAFASGEAALGDAGARSSDCLVLDYRLPGIDGLCLLRRLREVGVDCPAIVITSNPPRQLRREIDKAGARLVEKPLLSNSLARAIAALNGRSQSAAQ